jgi:hypothetical protein
MEEVRESEEEEREQSLVARFGALGPFEENKDASNAHPMDPLAKAEQLRAQERQTFISAVSRNLGIGINDVR